MKEYLPQNTDLLNQVAKMKLEEAKADPTPQHLYLLQLMNWGLDGNQAEIDQSLADNLGHVVGAMLSKPPARVMAWFQYPEGRLRPNVRPALLQSLDPAAAARELLDALSDRLSAESPWSPPKSAESLAV
jgi:hypothetical protein